MNRWSPDTCNCSFDFEPLEKSDQTLINVIKKCAIHSNLSDIEAHRACLDENQTRQLGRRILLEEHPELIPRIVISVTDIPVVPPRGMRIEKRDDGKFEIILNSEPNITLDFDDKRDIVITAPGLDDASKKSMNAKVDGKFAKKVTFQ